MLQPTELKPELPVELSNNVITTTTKVWEILSASYKGNIAAVKKLGNDCHELLYAQYNYTPPIHFSVREGHTDLVEYLLAEGAYDPAYKIYPFQDSLVTIANDRGYNRIAEMLLEYKANPHLQKYKGDNGAIDYQRTAVQQEFEHAVDKENIDEVERLLHLHPHLLDNDNYFWGEGILMMPAKAGNYKLLEVLLNAGAVVPDILKWAQFYYFEKYESAKFMIENRMSVDVMSWHHVTLLHDMAQKDDLHKAALLINHGARLNVIEEEYQSTPLGLAARWGNENMVLLLLEEGADPDLGGASWSTPIAWARSRKHDFIQNILLAGGAKG